MNPDYELYEQIDRYLNQSMSKQELAAFHLRLASDASLKETVEAQKLANELILDEELVHLKERMRKDMNGNSGISTSTKFIIASFLALSSAFLIYFFTQKTEKTTSNITSTSGILENNSASTGVSSSVSSKPDDTNRSKVVIFDNNRNTVSSASEEQKNTLKDTNTEEIQSTNETASSDQVTPLNEEKKITAPLKTDESVNAKADCSTIHMSANASIYYESNTEAIISIDSKTIRGGTSPYLFALENQNFSTDNKFEEVPEGIHHVFIKDAYGCISEVKKLVVKFPEKTIDESFNPSQGEKWTFPTDGNQEGTITIQNKSGQIVYAKTIQGGYPSEWDGLDNNGNELNAGNYLFIINFTNKKVVKGHISIYK